MTLSAKWTAVSFFALTALAAGSFAFAGCTVTTGTPSNIEGGSGITPSTDGGSGSDAGDAAPAATCEGNKQTYKLSDACQAALNAECCAELKGCFNIVIDKDAGGPTNDCNTYAACSALAVKQPTPADQQAAQKECNLGAPKSVQDAFGELEKCQTNKPGPNKACQ